MIDIDYNKLKCFLVIVESGSITLASKKLFRTQSAVSQTLHNLEQSLGISLIEWKGKQLKLTREGQLIYYAACSHIKAVHSQILTIIDAGKEVGGCVEIGVLKDRSTNVQEYLLNSLVKFKNRYPLVKFKLNFGTSLEIEQGLLNQKLDLGMLINFRERDRFHLFKVCQAEHIVATSPNYLKKCGHLTNLLEVLKSDLIDIDESLTCFKPWLQKHDLKFLAKIADITPAVVVPDFLAIKELILLGQGL